MAPVNGERSATEHTDGAMTTQNSPIRATPGDFGIKFARHTPPHRTCGIKLAQHAIKHPFWAILPTLGEYFHAIAIDSRRWANFVAPIPLTAPRDETVDTNAGSSARLRETHDAFAR